MASTSVQKSNSTIDVGSNASYDIVGNYDTILLGSNDIVSATGSALNITASGAGNTITVGGNGAFASNDLLNSVTLKAAGLVRVLANSRVAVYGSASNVTVADNATVGVYGYGNIVTAGKSDRIYIGWNNQTATGNSINVVHGMNGGSLYEAQNANTYVDGAYFSATLNGQDTLTAMGKGMKITASGTGNIVNIGGNGRYTVDADVNSVAFQASGTLNVFQNARVGATASSSVFNITGQDTIGVFGVGDLVNAFGTGNEVWIGQNGQKATGAAVHVVRGLNAGALYELQNSNVTVDGSNYVANMAGSDTLTASGSGVTVNAKGTGNILNFTTGTANFASGGVVNLGLGANATINGDSVIVNANSSTDANPVTMTVVGAGDQVNYAGLSLNLTIGQNGRSGATDVVNVTSATRSNSTVKVLAQSDVTVNGYGVMTILNGNDVARVNGPGNWVADVVGGVGGNRIFLGGNRIDPYHFQLDEVALNGKGDSVTMAADTGANLNNYDRSGSLAAVSLGANDYVSLNGLFAVSVPTSAGSETIKGFSVADTLALANHFASAAALLDATTEVSGSSVIALDASGGSLTLVGVTKAAFTADVQAGHVTFA